jgi:hypothetical protein
MLPGGKQPLTKSLSRAGRLECGKSASCLRESRLYQVALFLSGSGMGDTRCAWWRGGHRQQYGLDYEDTFAPVSSYRTMCMILTASAHENLVLRQFDVRTAFLNGELEEEVYVRPPPGAEHLAVGNKRVLQLRRALHGLKQASHAWNKRLKVELRAKGFSRMWTRPCGFCVGKVWRSLSCFVWTMAWWRQKLWRRQIL